MPAAPLVRYRRARFRPRRVHHRDQAQQGHVRLRVRGRSTGLAGDGQHPEAVAGQALLDLADPFTIRRGQQLIAAVASRQAAAGEHVLGRPLGIRHDDAIRRLVNRRHTPALRRERDLPDARRGVVDRGGIQAGLDGRHDQRPFGGVAFHVRSAIPADQPCIRRKHRGGQQEAHDFGRVDFRPASRNSPATS